MKNSLLLLLVLCVYGVAGCCADGKGKGPSAQIQPYTGPTLSTSEVVAKINANSEKIPSLWSSLYYKANIIDERHNAHFVNGEGNLLYRQAMDLRLVGRKDPAGVVFDVGSNKNEFWLRVIPELDTMWWGTYEELSRVNPDRLSIPIRPDLVLGVLGVNTIITNPDVLPAPAMRFVNDQDAYVFIWNSRLPDRWVSLREVWYDRQTLRPRLVLLYDLNGRVVLRAVLGMDKQIPVENLPKEQWPWVAGDYKLTFPDTGSTMEFTLSDDTTLKHGAVPSDRSFTMPSPQNPGVSRVIHVGESGSGTE